LPGRLVRSKIVQGGLDMANESDAAAVEEVGILLVHGMGEQEQHAHLKATAREFGFFLDATQDVLRLSIVEQPEKPGIIVVDAAFKHSGGGERRVRFHLHEAWWADLGISGGAGAQLKFWLWGLGMWAARVIRKGNPSRNTMKLMTVPHFGPQKSEANAVAPGFFRKLPSRAMLAGAALLAILTFFTWSAAKRVIAFLSNRGPDPSLIFLFLGDVMIYAEDGGPTGGSLQDPGQPMRATIRRRVVGKMVEMAAYGYDRWYIFAHSLGTVPAFNAVQETELALPNYLTEAQWRGLPKALKTKNPYVPAATKHDPPKTKRMMPRRPAWLEDTDAIDRVKLFARFRGLVTYGSPLDKFAALWPRVVPLNLQADVFPVGCEWVNLHDPTDPVSASLDAFAPPPNIHDPSLKLAPIKPHNVPTRASPIFGLSHIRYFCPRRGSPNSMPEAIAEALADGTSLARATDNAKMTTAETWARALWSLLQLIVLVAALTVAAAYVLILVGKALPDQAAARVRQVLDAIDPRLVEMIRGDWPEALLASGLILLALAALAILASGLTRMVADLIRPAHS